MPGIKPVTAVHRQQERNAVHWPEGLMKFIKKFFKGISFMSAFNWNCSQLAGLMLAFRPIICDISQMQADFCKIL